MFVYPIQNPAALLSHITLSGQYITFWQRQNYGSELSIFGENNKELLNPLKWAEDVRHLIFHNDRDFSQHHLHCMIRVSLTEEVFNNLIDRLIQASTPEARQASYEYFFQDLNRQRIKCHDSAFPSHVQRIIDNFNRTTPIFPATEADAIRHAYQAYQKSRKQSSHIFSDHFDKLLQIFCELCFVARWNKEQNSFDRELIFNQLKKILNLLKLQNYHTNQFILTHLREEVSKLMKNTHFNHMEALLQNRNDRESYPLPPLRAALLELDRDLSQIKCIIRSTWHKSFWNSVSAGLGTIATFSSGFGACCALAFGGLSSVTMSVISRRRDWHKHNSYQTVKDNQAPLTADQQVSVEAGILAAESTSKQFTALFNVATWKDPCFYYGAMVAKQLNDQLSLTRLRAKVR